MGKEFLNFTHIGFFHVALFSSDIGFTGIDVWFEDCNGMCV